MRTKDATASELTTPGGQPPSSGRDSVAGRGVGKLHNAKKGMAAGTTRLEAVVMGKLEVG